MKYKYRNCEANSRWACFVSDSVASKHGIVFLALCGTWIALFCVEMWYRSSVAEERVVIALDGPISIVVLLVVISALWGLAQIIRDQRKIISLQPDCFAYEIEVDELGVAVLYSNCASRFEWRGLETWKVKEAGIELVFHSERLLLRRSKINATDFAATETFLTQRQGNEVPPQLR